MCVLVPYKSGENIKLEKVNYQCVASELREMGPSDTKEHMDIAFLNMNWAVSMESLENMHNL